MEFHVTLSSASIALGCVQILRVSLFAICVTAIEQTSTTGVSLQVSSLCILL